MEKFLFSVSVVCPKRARQRRTVRYAWAVLAADADAALTAVQNDQSANFYGPGYRWEVHQSEKGVMFTGLVGGRF